LLHSSRIGCCAKHPWGVPSCVKDARERAFAAARAGWSDPCIFLFFCRFGSSIPGLTISNNTHSLVPAARFCARGFASLLHSPRIEGWAERRETFGCCAKHPWDTPSCVKDARERAYDAGRSPLGAPPWRFWAPGAALPSPSAPAVLQRRAVALRIRAASSSHPGRSAWRAGSLPPEQTVTSRRRRTPRLAPPSGSSPETPLDERGSYVAWLRDVVK
jgi:hypothetical protein